MAHPGHDGDAAAQSAELVSLHYSSRQGQDLSQRKRSDVIALREYNNWVRAPATRLLCPHGV